MSENRVLLRRLDLIVQEFRMRRMLHEDDCLDYPHPLAPSAWRKYFCIATGGCRWGDPYVDDVLGAVFPGEKSVRCWKCRAIWGNWSSTHNQAAATFNSTGSSNTNVRRTW